MLNSSACIKLAEASTNAVTKKNCEKKSLVFEDVVFFKKNFIYLCTQIKWECGFYLYEQYTNFNHIWKKVKIRSS